MSYNASAAIPIRARSALNRLAELGIKLPKPVADAANLLTATETFTPAPRDPHALRDAILAGKDHDTLHAIVLADYAHSKIDTAASAARTHAAHTVLAAIRNAASEIHPQLATLAQATIEKLRAAAKVGDVPLDALVRAGRHADAEAVAGAAVAEQQFLDLCQTRRRLLWPERRGLPIIDVTVWTDPAFNGHSLIHGLNAGGELWFGTYSEVCQRADQIAAAEANADQAVLAGTRGA